MLSTNYLHVNELCVHMYKLHMELLFNRDKSKLIIYIVHVHFQGGRGMHLIDTATSIGLGSH